MVSILFRHLSCWATRGKGPFAHSSNDRLFPGLPTGCDTGLIESNQILTLTAHGNIGELSFSGNSAIMFNSLSEISFGQVRGLRDHRF